MRQVFFVFWLSRYFGFQAGFFMRLQLDDDMRKARRTKGELIEREVIPAA
jgi:plasmid maintenance system antidote protein VapI